MASHFALAALCLIRDKEALSKKGNSHSESLTHVKGKLRDDNQFNVCIIKDMGMRITVIHSSLPSTTVPLPLSPSFFN
jgi:hypothetical protein